MEVDRASECCYERAFDLKHLRRTNFMSRYELDEDVNVAIGPIFAPRDGPEYRRVDHAEGAQPTLPLADREEAPD